ncbi:MAG: tetratricopeptide repeat protein [Candidatus Omnitrophota bacterium]
MKRILLCLIIAGVPLTAFARTNPLADIETAIIQEDYKKARELAKESRKAYLLRDDAARAGYYLGLCFLRLGDYPQAHDVFKQVLHDRPVDEIYEKASIGVIDTLYLQGFYENARKEAVALMNRQRHSGMMSLIYLKVARANLRLSQWAKAHEFLEKIIKEYPRSFESKLALQLLEEKQYFAVQVGAFIDKGHAEQLMRDLIDRREYSYIVETTAPDGRLFYRVRVGRITALKDALELEAKLSGLGYPTRIYP